MSHKTTNTVVKQPEEEADILLDFWQNACTVKGTVTPKIIPNVFFVGVITGIICFLSIGFESYTGSRLELGLTPHEFIGAALAVVLVLRTNAGYDRWWEGRKIWGGIVNQSRNLAISALAYGPNDKKWRAEFCRWVAVYSHVTRLSLRGEKPDEKVESLIGREAADMLAYENHMPSRVALKLAELIKEAREEGLDQFAFLRIDRERAILVDHVGACERIMKTPLALAYCIKIRRFIAIFLITLPFALLHKLAYEWLVPLICMAVSYPLLSMDQLGIELQNPFDKKNLSHLPLDEICATIEGNILHLISKD